MSSADSPRYARQRVLSGFGEPAQQRLAAARVVVIGAGGLGSAVLPALAAAGVGTIVVVDHDAVDESNLPRQTVHGLRDVGRPKVDSAADRMRALTDHVTVITERERFDATTAAHIVAGADVLVDASDSPAARSVADAAAADAGIPLVWGSALGYGGQTGVVWDARGVRYGDLFPAADESPDSCEIVGVLPTVCTVIGGVMATEVLKLLTGIGDPLVGTVLDYDARGGRMRRLEFARGADAPTNPSPRPLPRQVEELDPAGLARELASDEPPILIDVRDSRETPASLLAGAIIGDLDELALAVDGIARDRRVVTVCRRGVRSRRAAELLHDAGFARVAHLGGGLEAWDRADLRPQPRY